MKTIKYHNGGPAGLEYSCLRVEEAIGEEGKRHLSFHVEKEHSAPWLNREQIEHLRDRCNEFLAEYPIEEKPVLIEVIE